MATELARTEIKTKRAEPKDFFRSEYCVKCSCGYVSRWFNFYSDAETDEVDHLRQAHP